MAAIDVLIIFRGDPNYIQTSDGPTLPAVKVDGQLIEAYSWVTSDDPAFDRSC